MTRWLLVVPFLVSFACTPEDRCSSHDDCWDSHAVQEAGKCAPEAWCEEGICQAKCEALCHAQDGASSCGGGLICNQSQSELAHDSPGRCTRHPIPCETVADCPVVRPTTESGEWSCEEGICRFPGFSYFTETHPPT